MTQIGVQDNLELSGGIEGDETEEGARLQGSLTQCKAKTVEGRRCKGKAGADGYCLFHSGAREAERAVWRSKGGRVRNAALAPVTGLPELDWSSTEGVLRTLSALTEALINGRVDSNRARVLIETTFRAAGLLGGDDSLLRFSPELRELLAVIGTALAKLPTIQITPLIQQARTVAFGGGQAMLDAVGVGLYAGTLSDEELSQALSERWAAGRGEDGTPSPVLCDDAEGIGGSADALVNDDPGASSCVALGEEVENGADQQIAVAVGARSDDPGPDGEAEPEHRRLPGEGPVRVLSRAEVERLLEPQKWQAWEPM